MTPGERKDRDVPQERVDVVDGPVGSARLKDPASPVPAGADLGTMPDPPIPGGIDNGGDDAAEPSGIDRL